MRKLSIFFLSGLLLFPLAACGGSQNGIPPGDEPEVDRQTDAHESELYGRYCLTERQIMADILNERQ